MFGLRPERLGYSINDGAADTRRACASTHSQRASLPCTWIGSRCRIRARRAAEPQLRGTRITRDAVPTPVVVTDVTTAESLITDAGADTALTTAFSLDNHDDDPNQLSAEQVENRRLSSLAASTSSIDGGLPGLRRPGSGTSAFPAFPRPKPSAAGPVAAPGPAAPGPSPQVQVPPEAAQLYLGSSVGANLSATTGSADVLISLLDALQLQLPGSSGPGGASNAQRVYRTAMAVPAEVTGASGGAGGAAGGTEGAAGGGGDTAAAGATQPMQVRRKRARTRVVDSSELLLARDEAVRTELISRIWNDLLGFEERLSAAPGAADTAAPARKAKATAAPPAAAQLQPQVAAPAAAALAVPDSRPQQQQQLAPSSLEDVLGFLQESAAVLKDEELAEQVAQQVQLRRAAERGKRLLTYVRRAKTWQRLARLYLKHGRAFSVVHLIVTLERLARFRSGGEVFRGRARRKAFAGVWDMLVQRVVFAAPRMTGFQVVRVVNALNALPFVGSKRVEQTLVTVQRVLRYGQHAMQQAAQDGGSGGPEDGGPGGGGGGRVILNASQVARQLGGRGATATAKGRPTPAPAAAVAAAASAASSSDPSDVGLVCEVDTGPAPMGGAEYASLCYALGRMSSRARPWRHSLRLSPSVARRLLLGSYSQLGSLGPREFAGLMYGLGCMRLSPPAPWMYGYYVNSVRCLPAMTDVQLTMVMYGACRLKIKPPPAWIESYLGAVGARLGGLDGASLAAAAHALGRLHYKPRPAWVEGYMTSALRVLTRGEMAAGEMSQMARGLMFLGVRPAEDVMDALWEASGRAMEREDFSAAQLANLAWALGNLKVPTPRSWVEQLMLTMRRSHVQLQRPYHRRRLLSALHAFGCRDLPRWYLVLRIPLEEMPGYEAWSALQAKQRAVQQAKAVKQGQPAKLAAAGAQVQPAEAAGAAAGRKRRQRRDTRREPEAGSGAQLKPLGGRQEPTRRQEQL